MQLFVLPATAGGTRHLTDATDCDNGVLESTFDGNWRMSVCYRQFDEAVTWFTAANRCLEKNATLAVFSDSGITSGWTSHTYWVGLVKSWWTWPDIGGVDVVYNNFVEWNETNHDPATTGIPTQFPNNGYDCAIVQSTKWLVKQCSDVHRVVCQSAPVQITTTQSAPVTATGHGSASILLPSTKGLLVTVALCWLLGLLH
jgi:hypothetical protein